MKQDLKARLKKNFFRITLTGEFITLEALEARESLLDEIEPSLLSVSLIFLSISIVELVLLCDKIFTAL